MLGRLAAVVLSCARQAQGSIQDFRSGSAARRPRPAEPNGDDHVERPKRKDLGWGRWGVRDGGKRQGGDLGGR